MEYSSQLQKAKLIKRYKRFLADVIFENGERTTVHCPNTGSMTTCGSAGDIVFLSESPNPKRKYKYTWELTVCPQGFIGINTHRPNKIVHKAIIDGFIPELEGYDQVNAEAPWGDNSRIDFLLNANGSKQPCYVEVKNVSLKSENGTAVFPDAKTERGQKHLVDLKETVKAGHRACLFFMINRPDVDEMEVNAEIDHRYHELLGRAMDVGVEILPYRAQSTLQDTKLEKKIPFTLR